MTLELSVVVGNADPRAKDEGRSYRENYAVEVCQALDRKFTESPYLARQLSVFDDRQPVTGVPGTVFGGLRRTQELDDECKKTAIYIGSDSHDRVIAFTSSRREPFALD